MADQSLRQAQIKELYTLTQENFYTENQHLSRQDLKKQWKIETAQMAKRLGIAGVSPTSLEQPHTLKKMTSMSRAQTVSLPRSRSFLLDFTNTLPASANLQEADFCNAAKSQYFAQSQIFRRWIKECGRDQNHSCWESRNLLVTASQETTN